MTIHRFVGGPKDGIETEADVKGVLNELVVLRFNVEDGQQACYRWAGDNTWKFEGYKEKLPDPAPPRPQEKESFIKKIKKSIVRWFIS